MKRLKRSTKDVLISGVAAGIAEHLNIDPTLIRILWVFLIFVSLGFAVIMYIVMWIIVPKEEDNTKKKIETKTSKAKSMNTKSEKLVSSENTNSLKNKN